MKNLLIVLFSVVSGLSCNKECQGFVDYLFELPATLSPAKDTFRIGDTITITSEFSHDVYDKATNRTYKLENFKFYPRTSIMDISQLESISNFSETFSVIVPSNYNYSLTQFSDNSEKYYGDYNYDGDKYILSYSLIPKQTGLYYLRFGSGLYTLGGKQDFEGRCPKGRAGLDAFLKLNDGADNNIHLLKSSPDPHYNEWMLRKETERFHKFGGYCFVVVE